MSLEFIVCGYDARGCMYSFLQVCNTTKVGKPPSPQTKRLNKYSEHVLLLNQNSTIWYSRHPLQEVQDNKFHSQPTQLVVTIGLNSKLRQQSD